jgi:flagellar basal-body rod protein FlgC
MSLFGAMEISAGGLHAQRTVMDAVSMNLAHAHTTRTDEQTPYRRRRATLTHLSGDHPFEAILSTAAGGGRLMRTHENHFPRIERLSFGDSRRLSSLKAEVVEEPQRYRTVYDPSHPDADSGGYVNMPDINPMEEMVTLMGAVRSYEANVTAFNAAKGMALKALEIGR